MITPPVTLITHGIVAIAAAAGAWVWQANSYEAKLATVQTEYAQAQHRAVETAHADTIRLQTRKDEAVKAATVRAQTIAADRDRLRAAVDGLRSDIATSAASANQATDAARTEHAAAIGAVLSECAGEIAELAGKADGHVSDIRLIIGAWPD